MRQYFILFLGISLCCFGIKDLVSGHVISFIISIGLGSLELSYVCGFFKGDK
jgi:hypothetical protein